MEELKIDKKWLEKLEEMKNMPYMKELNEPDPIPVGPKRQVSSPQQRAIRNGY
jgi:hypothetical protein